jgi:hypothetical protein
MTRTADRSSRRRWIGAAAVAAVTIATTAGMLATSSPAASTPKTQQLNGTWLTTITLVNPPQGVPPSFMALNTFFPSGELIASSSQVLPSTRTLAHGGWARVANRRFASTFTAFRFDAAGIYAGMLRVRRTLTLSADGRSLTPNDVVEMLNPAGTVVASFQATETGHRVPVTGA